MSFEIHWELVAMLLVVIAVLRKRLVPALLVVGAAIAWDALGSGPGGPAAGGGASPSLAEQLGPIGIFLLATIGLLPSAAQFGQGHAP